MLHNGSNNQGTYFKPSLHPTPSPQLVCILHLHHSLSIVTPNGKMSVLLLFNQKCLSKQGPTPKNPMYFFPFQTRCFCGWWLFFNGTFWTPLVWTLIGSEPIQLKQPKYSRLICSALIETTTVPFKLYHLNNTLTNVNFVSKLLVHGYWGSTTYYY